ncbi:peptidoglycan-binding protein [Nonomuraea sp. NPDC000554]|uniref:peptidoglycan-binding protein n=1 Tax=Nonomuraea sp. NPDC000554 TaxID=3154259 RepID=UPI00331BC279
MAFDLIKRGDWGARAPRGDYTQLESTKGTKVHYTGGRVNPAIVDDHDGCAALVRSIQNSHMDGNGWIDIGYCVDEETEILTQRGWTSYRELQVGDIALTLDHELGVSRWQPVLEVCVFPARRREMVRMQGPGHSSRTTPQHRWPVEGPRRERLWVTTETIGHRDRILLAAPCADLPAEAKWSDAFVELVAWFGGRPSVTVRPAHVTRVRAALSALLGRAPGWHESPAGDLVEFQLSDDAGRRLLEAAPGGVPGLGFLLALTRAQLALLVDTFMVAGDGRPAWKDRAAAEAFMFAALLAGHSAAIRHTGSWEVVLEGRHHLAPRERDDFQIVREEYHGEIWCPRTENQSWLARRDGTVYFTGNTYVACPHRKVFEGRGPHHLPAANGAGLNSGHYAVLGLVGNAGLVVPPDTMLHAILDAAGHLRELGNAGKEIKGHRDGYNTDCPGERLYAWVKRGAPRPGGGGGEPGTSAPPFPGRLLRYPPVTRGDDVRTWQQQMRRRGWTVDVDGAYGPEARDVCRRFQREQHIDDDGTVGPLTWRLTWEAP